MGCQQSKATLNTLKAHKAGTVTRLEHKLVPRYVSDTEYPSSMQYPIDDFLSFDKHLIGIMEHKDCPDAF